MQTQAQKIAAFRSLHERGCFQVPNPWDVGSARYLEALGFKALASTSAGFAWSMGRLDYGLKVDEVVAHLALLTAAVDLPVNADFEGGFAVEPEGVAANVTRAVVEGGVAGLSIEDRAEPGASPPLLDFDLSVARIKAARAAIDAIGTGVLLTARCEGLLVGMTDLSEIVERLKAYAEAGGGLPVRARAEARRTGARGLRRVGAQANQCDRPARLDRRSHGVARRPADQRRRNPCVRGLWRGDAGRQGVAGRRDHRWRG